MQVGILLQAKQIYCVNSHWQLEAYGKRNVSIEKHRLNVHEHKKEMAVWSHDERTSKKNYSLCKRCINEKEIDL